MDILEFIKSRRSTRKFTDKEIEAEKLDQILEAGRYAPSGGNSQSTHFLVIQDKDVFRHLSGNAKIPHQQRGGNAALHIQHR